MASNITTLVEKAKQGYADASAHYTKLLQSAKTLYT